MTKYNLSKLNPEVDREVSELTFFAVMDMAQMQDSLQPTDEENEFAAVLTDMCGVNTADTTAVESFKRLITSIFRVGRLEGERCERRKNTADYLRQCLSM